MAKEVSQKKSESIPKSNLKSRWAEFKNAGKNLIAAGKKDATRKVKNKTESLKNKAKKVYGKGLDESEKATKKILKEIRKEKESIK